MHGQITPLRVDAAVRSLRGTGQRWRAENQDNYLLIREDGSARFLYHQQEQCLRLPHWPRGHVRAAVLDGVGGHGQGREAAEAVVHGLLDIAPCPSAAMLAERLDQLHTRLQRGFDATPRPGTTLTLLDLPPGGPAQLYHVGDSRLYALDCRAARPLTIDHVPATRAALAGQMPPAQWWRQVHGEHRPQITQAFIMGHTFHDSAGLADDLHPLTAGALPDWLAPLADRRTLHLLPGQRYLLATDGFWSCPAADAWVARWPALLGGCACAAAGLDALVDAIAMAPPAGLHADNLTALLLVLPPGEETAIPAPAP